MVRSVGSERKMHGCDLDKSTKVNKIPIQREGMSIFCVPASTLLTGLTRVQLDPRCSKSYAQVNWVPRVIARLHRPSHINDEIEIQSGCTSS